MNILVKACDKCGIQDDGRLNTADYINRYLYQSFAGDGEWIELDLCDTCKTNYLKWGFRVKPKKYEISYDKK